MLLKDDKLRNSTDWNDSDRTTSGFMAFRPKTSDRNLLRQKMPGDHFSDLNYDGWENSKIWLGLTENGISYSITSGFSLPSFYTRDAISEVEKWHAEFQGERSLLHVVWKCFARLLQLCYIVLGAWLFGGMQETIPVSSETIKTEALRLPKCDLGRLGRPVGSNWVPGTHPGAGRHFVYGILVPLGIWSATLDPTGFLRGSQTLGVSKKTSKTK